MHMEKITPPPSSPRVAALLRTVAKFERDDIEIAVDSLIALLDARDGDPDLEPNGDELDASYPEDEFAFHRVLKGLAPGNEDAEDDEEDRCEAGDDHMIDGPVAQLEWWNPYVRSGRAIGDEDDTAVDDDTETLTWAEQVRQPSYMGGGIAMHTHDEDEPDHVPPEWRINAATDDDRAAA